MLIKGATSLMSATLGGDVTIDQINSEGDVYLITLTNIVYIPTLPINLVLVSRLLEGGIQFYYRLYQILTINRDYKIAAINTVNSLPIIKTK